MSLRCGSCNSTRVRWIDRLDVEEASECLDCGALDCEAPDEDPCVICGRKSYRFVDCRPMCPECAAIHDPDDDPPMNNPEESTR